MESSLLLTLHLIHQLSIADMETVDQLSLADARLLGAKIVRVRVGGVSVYRLKNWPEIERLVLAWMEREHSIKRGDSPIFF